MKKTLLKRKTPLRKVRKLKAVWLRKYAMAKKMRIVWMILETGYTFDEYSEENMRHHVPESQLEPHHPNGRTGKNILDFKFTTRERHKWIHEHANEARKLGWLK